MAADRRAVNDYRRRAFSKDASRRVAFVCECADEACRRAVLLTIAEYDAVCAAGGAVVVDPSHPQPGFK